MQQMLGTQILLHTHMCKMEKICTASKPTGGAQRSCSWCGELCSNQCGECGVPLGFPTRHAKCWAFWHCPLVGESAFLLTKKKPDDEAIALERARLQEGVRNALEGRTIPDVRQEVLALENGNGGGGVGGGGGGGGGGGAGGSSDGDIISW
jgi:hypothetical protein